VILLSFFLSSFFVNYPPSSLNGTTKIDHMLESKCNLKMHVENVGYTLPLQIGTPKPHFFADFAT